MEFQLIPYWALLGKLENLAMGVNFGKLLGGGLDWSLTKPRSMNGDHRRSKILLGDELGEITLFNLPEI